MSGLIWIQTVCKGYQQTTLVGIKLKQCSNDLAKEKMHLKMLSAEVVRCKKLPNITDELSIESSSLDPEQTAPI